MKIKVDVRALPVGVFTNPQEEARVKNKTFIVTGERVSPLTGEVSYFLDDEKFPHVQAKYAIK